MEDATSVQISKNAAEVYEDFFVPALFRQFAGPVADCLALRPGQSVLDVGCGTGVLAREALARVLPGGSVTGLDSNEAMLAVAQRLAPALGWRAGSADSLPFDSAAFDAVGCQFALMFFPDRVAALREMWRVLRPGGHLAVAVWAPLAASPGYAAMAVLLERLFGATVAAALRAPFVLGGEDKVLTLFREAGIEKPAQVTQHGSARFESLKAWLHTEIRGWTLAEVLDDAQFARLLAEARNVLGGFADAEGRIAFAAPAQIVTARKS
jgi:SAM-dependent methyltransferase